MEYVLTTQGLPKQYGRFKALDGLTMRVPKGAVYGFVGKNGAGKTTLIRVVCGLQVPTAGAYTLYGIDSRDRSIVRSRRPGRGENCQLLSAQERDESLESYFINLVGGGGHA